jgi:8-oxo-dGTP pyrophosphatase MutT (NUDIX family)
MFVPRILSRGAFRLSDIRVELSDQEWIAPGEFERLVDVAWREKLAEAQGHRIWDGTYYRVANVEDWKTAEDALSFRLGTVSYRYIATFRELYAEHAARGLEPLHHLATAALIHTRDGQCIFGRRSRNGAVDLIGGGVQRDELTVVCGSDIAANLLKEIREEVGIRDTQVEDIAGLGILLSSTSNVLVVADVLTTLSQAEAEASFREREDDEMAEIVFVSRDALQDFLRGMSDCRTLIADLM